MKDVFVCIIIMIIKSIMLIQINIDWKVFLVIKKATHELR